MSSVNSSIVQEQRARKAALSSFVGAVVDWYDFLLYGIVAALIFKDQFFPSIGENMGTLAALATFGVGFLFRPLGGVVFGHFGDKLGRKKMLVLTVILMGISTVGIGLLPNFEAIGWWAPVLLVFCRALQGFAVGGEWGGAALMAVENAPKGKKAFYSSGVQVGYGVGLVLATGAVSIILATLGEEAFAEWAWRIPFLASIVLLAVAMWIRRDQDESQEFVEKVVKADHQPEKLPIFQAISKHPKAFFYIIALRLTELLTMYLVTNFALNYSTTNLGMDKQFFLNITLMVGAISCFSIPFFAWLADKFNHQKMCVWGGLIGALSAFPFFYGARCTKHLDDHCRGNFTGERRTRYGGQCPSTDFHLTVWHRIPLQRCRSWLSGGEYHWGWIYPIYCSGTGDLGRWFMALCSHLSGGGLSADCIGRSPDAQNSG